MTISGRMLFFRLFQLSFVSSSCLLSLIGVKGMVMEIPTRRDVISGTMSAIAGSSFLCQSFPANAEIPTQQLGASPSDAYLPKNSGAKFNPEYDGKWSPEGLQTKLGKSRILADELSPPQDFSLFPDNELYYPPFLFGKWKVKATLKEKRYPYGKAYVPSKSLIEGSPRNREEQVGSTTTYELHYYSSLPDNNNPKKKDVDVRLSTEIPKSKIIADREFNSINVSNSYNQLTPIKEVTWDPYKDPTHFSLNYGANPVAGDMRPLGPRRGEVYIESRQREYAPNANADIFACSEKSRFVTIATRNVIVSDTEAITEFCRIGPNEVKAISRVAVYLTPNPNSREGVLWQEVRGKAVAFFYYDIEMERLNNAIANDNNDNNSLSSTEVEEEKTIASSPSRTCVKTPKDILQCAV